MADWENYVRQVATRYKGRVFTYELWNEPNMKDSYTGDVPHLVALCAAAYKVLKQVDPKIRVISPSPAPTGGVQYYYQFMDAGGGDTFDVLGFHFYDNLASHRINPEGVMGAAQLLHKSLVHRGFPSKPVWNTESGYYISSDPGAKVQAKGYPADVHVLSQTEGVAAVSRSYIVGWACGIERFYWYGWGEYQYAIVDDGGNHIKPATIAYRTTRQWLLGAKYVSMGRSAANRWIVTMVNSAGKTEHIVWTSSEPENQSFQVPADWHVTRQQDATGKTTPVHDATIDIGSVPLLLQ
jgi:hypothetical protein